MADRITARTNPTVQHVKKLRDNRRYRYECRAFLADGTKLAEEALRWGVGVDALFLTDGVDFSVPPGVREIRVSERIMAELSRMDTPQGVLALCRMPEPEPPAVTPGCLILDGIQDPGNLGTILRTADAFSVPVFLSEGCADPYGEKTVRAAMGAVFRTPPRQARSDALIAACRAEGIPLCVTALTDRAGDVRDLPLERCAVVVGSEGRGVSRAYLEAADLEAVIPMSPRCESLNAAVAAAILLWQMRLAR